MDLDDLAQAAGSRRLACQQLLPGKEHRPPGKHIPKRVAQLRQRLLEPVEAPRSCAGSLGGEGKAVHDAAQALVGRKGREQRTGVEQTLERALHFLDWHEEERILIEEAPACGLKSRLNQGMAGSEFFRQL